jgi:hypothetical protein
VSPLFHSCAQHRSIPFPICVVWKFVVAQISNPPRRTGLARVTVGQIATETKVTAIIERIALIMEFSRNRPVVLVMILSILSQRNRWCGH